MDGLNKTSEHLIYLMSCALRGAEASADALNGINLHGLLSLARNHSVAAMVCMALEKTTVFAQADPEVKKQWLDAKNKAIRKNMLLDADRRILMDEMEHAGIWHLPLKGSILKEWYPQCGMREMADNDILFDRAKRKQVRNIFEKHGYSVTRYNKGNHDVYFKPPVYNYEMHVTLFSEGFQEKLAKKYTEIEKKLIPDEGKKYCFHFTHEDFYVFVLSHAYKHYSHSGTGIRTLADIYVMNHRIGPLLDWNYVEKELEELGIREYEQCSRMLSEKIFGGNLVSEVTLTTEEHAMLLYYMKANTYGNIENSVNNSLHSIQSDEGPITGLTKLKYCVSRLFPGRKWCKDLHPLIYRYPCLLPFFWVWRWITKIPVLKRVVQKELSALRSSK